MWLVIGIVRICVRPALIIMAMVIMMLRTVLVVVAVNVLVAPVVIREMVVIMDQVQDVRLVVLITLVLVLVRERLPINTAPAHHQLVLVAHLLVMNMPPLMVISGMEALGLPLTPRLMQQKACHFSVQEIMFPTIIMDAILAADILELLELKHLAPVQAVRLIAMILILVMLITILLV